MTVTIDLNWQRYHGLIAKRRAEALSPDEHRELIALSDEVERANARRMGHLIELSRVRGVPIEALMTDLSIPRSNPSKDLG